MCSFMLMSWFSIKGRVHKITSLMFSISYIPHSAWGNVVGPGAQGRGQRGQGGMEKQSGRGAHCRRAQLLLTSSGGSGSSWKGRSSLVVKHSAHVLWQLDLSKVIQ